VHRRTSKASLERRRQHLRSVLRTWRFIAEHPLGRRRRLNCLARWARWQLVSRLSSQPVICPFVNDAKLAVEPGMTGATGNVYVGLHEFADMAFILHVLRPGDLFLDLGANVGSYTVLASAVAGARSIACEPIPATFAKLQRNLQLNRLEALADARCVAVGAAPGTLRFIADRDTTNQVAPADYAGATADVPVTTVDAWQVTALPSEPQQRPADDAPLIIWKADLEGHEPAMLAGAANTLAAGAPHAMLIESDAPAVAQTLANHDFRRAAYSPFERRLAPSDAQADSRNFLWIRAEAWEAVLHRLQSAKMFHVQGISV
jgi:FkbM family methyltransferase